MPRYALVLAVAVGVMAVSAPVAAAATQTVDFTTVGEHQFTVPAGVTSVEFAVTGAAGGNSGTSVGGRGATVTGTLTVFPGQLWYVQVGGRGTNATTSSSAIQPGGANGGGQGAAGGGGASDIRTLPTAFAGSLTSRVVVAGGGGGSAFRSIVAQGGAGGDAGAPGVDTSGGAGGGQPGTQAAGGAGGLGTLGGNDGTAGVLGFGGAGGGPNWRAGGGGGGYYGGGGGAGMASCNPCNRNGGGGGGSSLAPADATVALAAAGTEARVSFTYELAGPQPSAPGLDFPATTAGSLSPSQTLTVSNTAASTQLLISGLDVDSDEFLLTSSTCQGPVDPGASCHLRVRFTPSSAGAKSGVLTILSNAPDPVAVSLTGTGTAPPSAFGPAGQPGPAGARGLPGSDGAAGAPGAVRGSRLALISCRRTRLHGWRCYARFVGPTPRVTARSPVRARLTRAGRTFATMRRMQPRGPLRVTLAVGRTIAPRRYNLRVRIGNTRLTFPALVIRGVNER
jgi:Glycine rich protein/Abnormal spindle-like microcephaly-assoc'd, ASPM-SPD-2-Hydin